MKVLKKNLELLGLLLAIVFISIFFLTYKIKTTENNPGSKDLSLEGVKNYIIGKMEVCQEPQAGNQCFKETTKDFLNQFTYKEVLNAFGEIETRPEIFSHCHEVMHYLGQDEYLSNKDISKTLSESSSVCFSGSYHGAVEGYFLDHNISLDSDTYPEQIKTICGQKITYSIPAIYDQCIHGIGHALMFLTVQDLPKSLKLCDETTISQPDAELCYSGVFMENANSSTNKDHPTKYLKKDDPFYPCNAIEVSYQKMCYTLQVPYFFEFTNHDWNKTNKLCAAVPENYRLPCYQQIGSNQVGFSQSQETMKQNCDLISSAKYKIACVEGVVGTLATRYSGDSHRILTFCALVDPDNQKNCYQQMGRSLKFWLGSTAAKLQCKKTMALVVQTWCMETAN